MSRRRSMTFVIAYVALIAALAYRRHQLPTQRRDWEMRSLNRDFSDFVPYDTGAVENWLPQVVFLVLFVPLGYSALRQSLSLRPRPRPVLAVIGAALLAGGLADVLRAGLQARRVTELDFWSRFAAHLENARGEGALFAPQFVSAFLLIWLLAWLLSVMRRIYQQRSSEPRELWRRFRNPPLPELAAPPLSAPRARRDAALTALLPVLLLALAGASLMRHADVSAPKEGTVDLDEWSPPSPSLAERWSGVLYPALRLRPVADERFGGWLAALTVAVTLLVLLAVLLLGSLSRPTVRRRRLTTLVCEGWYATVLAACAAAAVETYLFGRSPPIGPGLEGRSVTFFAAFPEAVRFGAVWGWSTGLALAAAVWVLRRTERGHHGAESSGAVPEAPGVERADAAEPQKP